jgi:tetratricopeptide (TPR) repeat protein
VVFSSRQRPQIALGRLQLVGDVARLGTDELRFDLAETTSLFNETYGRDLDSVVVQDLVVRTEGWAASLHLVQAALRDRSTAEIRRFVRNLDGADRDLYDYLAEVGVGDLPEQLQRCLMTSSILQVVTPEWAQVASGASAADVGRSMTGAERLALLSQVSGGPRSHMRYHPLVRGFLTSRLTNLEGEPAVAALHRRVAIVAAETDWRVAVYHYHEAGDEHSMLETMDAAIPTIMANAQYSLVEALLGDLPTDRRPAGSHLVLSRVDLQHGDYEGAARGAQAVLDASTSDPIQRDHALLNLLTIHLNYGHGERALERAIALRDATEDSNLRSIAEASIAILGVTTERDLDDTNRKLRSMARRQRNGRAHHFGVTMYNLAANSLAQDRLQDAEREVDQALEAFRGTSSIVERQAAKVLRIGILLRTGRLAEALASLRAQLDDAENPLQNDALLEAADSFDAFGDRLVAQALLDRVSDSSAHTLVDRRITALTKARIHLRRGELNSAAKAMALYPDGVSTVVGLDAARLVVVAQIAIEQNHPNAQETLGAAIRLASSSGIHSARRIAELLAAAQAGATALNEAISSIASSSPWHLTMIAEVIAPRLSELSDGARRHVESAAGRHPDRWRTELRTVVDKPGSEAIDAARILELVGEREDIRRLRTFANLRRKDKGFASLGRSLSRQLADRVFVEDQGRVLIRIGNREVPGSSIRRKVLAMLCVLLARPDMAATRDKVLDTLWPDLDPDVAVNSLNQTLYFLRRVFEESYVEDLSPGYVHHEGDVIWLDGELVSSRAAQCERLIRSLPKRPSPDDVSRLVDLYHGRFALDFEYEEWASSFREATHASYLEIVERSLIDDVATGHLDRAISVARRPSQ